MVKRVLGVAPEQNAEFVCQMEEVLEVYHRPYDRNYSVVCLDENSKQQVKEPHPPWQWNPDNPNDLTVSMSAMG